MNSSSAARRSFWLKTLHQWHWISAAFSLAGMVLFAATGLTLNNAALVESAPRIENRQLVLPAAMLADLNKQIDQNINQAKSSDPASDVATADAARLSPARLSPPIRRWLEDELDVRLNNRPLEISGGELYLPLPQPGADAWLSIALDSGAVEYERSDRGWIAYFNDLHKGRHSGGAWGWFIDVFALACLVFALTGLALLAFHARQRRSTWPLTALGLLAPLILMLLFIH